MPTPFRPSILLCPGILCISLALNGCSRSEPQVDGVGPADAVHPSVAQAHRALTTGQPLDDAQSNVDAARGLVARAQGKIVAEDGTVLRDFDAYNFLDNVQAPPTVHPYLWRHAQRSAQAGLYKVTDGVYQVRGFDIANMTLIEGRTGWIVVDPLSARESAQQAMAFARTHLGNRPVSAIVFTHAHVDHFGGVLGIVKADEARQRKLPIVASAGFLEEATSENILVGNAMGRRSAYQFGKHLPRSATGNVDTGLGKDVVYGAIGILPPTVIVDQPDQPLTLDGVDFVFHNTPGAECPAEMTFHVPALKLYNGAELLSQTQHNLLPIRGAKVRDAQAWARYLQTALDQMDGVDTYIGQHLAPIWGRERIREFITVQRDVYQYTHDQTVRWMNQGLTAAEIANRVVLPDSLARHPAARGHYGDLRHNVKAVFQFYLGFYDGNPVHLDPLPPVEQGQRYVKLIGADRMLAAAREAFAAGDFRWSAALLNHLVMADANTPEAREARELLARTYEQMGYQSESATWRNSYLTGAQELRLGPPARGVSKAQALDMLMQVPTPRFLEALAASLKAEEAVGRSWRINLHITDRNERYVLWIENAVLHFRAAAPAPDAHASLALTSGLFARIIAGTANLQDTVFGSELQISGSKLDLLRFLSLLEKPAATFPIVTRG